MWKALKAEWKAMTTAQKIGCVIDIICGFGSAAAGAKIGAQLSAGSGKFESFCIRTVTTGACMAAGEAGSKALRSNFGDFAGAVIDKARGKNVEFGATMKGPEGPAFTATTYKEEA